MLPGKTTVYVNLLIINLLFPFCYPLPSLGGQAQGDAGLLARERYWQGDFLEAIRLWESLPPDSASKLQKAEVHSYLGVAYRQIGRTEAALHHLKESLKLYGDLEREEAVAVAVEMANLLNEVGHPRRAIEAAADALASLNPEDRTLKAMALRAIATGLLLQGDLDAAVDTYGQAIEAAGDEPEAAIGVSNDLGAALLQRRDFLNHQASLVEVEGYSEGGARLKDLARRDGELAAGIFLKNVQAVESGDLSATISTRTYLNAFKTSGDRHYLARAEGALNSLPASRAKAELLIELSRFQEDPVPYLERAASSSQSLGDHRTRSLALGEMGAFYEGEQEYGLALKFTEEAKWSAQAGGNEDILYRWQWQSGRLYRSLGKTQEARTSYLGATSTLQSLRFRLSTANPDLQLDFLEDAQPIYRELLSLLLDGAETLTPQQLREALKVRGQLELSELQAFFGDACSELQERTAAAGRTLKPGTARIYFILLDEGSYQILELPDGSLRAFSLGISKGDLEAKLLEWRRMLLTSRIPKGYEPLSKELYGLLLGRAIPTLPSSTKRLVFVGDGLLRNVPLAALVDGGGEFLLQRYAIAYSLSLPAQLKGRGGGYLAFGLSVRTDSFPPLPFVRSEIESISRLFDGKSFIDENFVRQNFEEQVRRGYGILHVATHAVFSGSARETFLQAFDSPIDLNEMEVLLRRAGGVDLLFLSACKTAAGNGRSALGLAGVGARAGISTVVASLWSVRDETTSHLVSDFYAALNQNRSAIDSLRQVQLKMLSSHPKAWAPFIAISNGEP